LARNLVKILLPGSSLETVFLRSHVPIFSTALSGQGSLAAIVFADLAKRFDPLCLYLIAARAEFLSHLTQLFLVLFGSFPHLPVIARGSFLFAAIQQPLGAR